VTSCVFKSKYRPGDYVYPGDLHEDWPQEGALVTRVQFDLSGYVIYRVQYRSEAASRLLDFREQYKVEMIP
jgi:hypothetical protein